MVQVTLSKPNGINVSLAKGSVVNVTLTGKFYGGSEGSGVPDGGVTSDLIADGAVTKPKLSEDIRKSLGDIPTLKNQLAGLLWGSAKFSMSGGKTVYADTNPNAIIKAVFTSSELTPDKIELTLPDNTVQVFEGVKDATYTDTTVRASGNYTYKGKATIGENMLSASTVLYVRNAVYRGMGVRYSDIMNNTYRIAATTSVANGSFSGASPSDGSKFYLIVPSDVSAPKTSEFTMGGAPASMVSSNVSVDGINYTVIETKGTYNQGTELNLNW